MHNCGGGHHSGNPSNTMQQIKKDKNEITEKMFSILEMTAKKNAFIETEGSIRVTE